MPMRSKAQRKFLWAKHPAIARRFEDHTPEGTKLPEHLKKSAEALRAKLAVQLQPTTLVPGAPPVPRIPVAQPAAQAPAAPAPATQAPPGVPQHQTAQIPALPTAVDVAQQQKMAGLYLKVLARQLRQIR